MDFTSASADLTPLIILTIALAVVGAWSDIRSRRIPNWLTVGGFVLALVIRGFGPETVLAGLAGAGIAFAITVVPYAMRAIGAGDVKYLVAFGAVLGGGRILGALLLVTLAAGVLALAAAVATGRAPALFRSSARLALYSVTLGRLGSRRVLDDDSAIVALEPIPLGVAIAVGCTLTWLI